MSPNPCERMPAKDALQHEWIDQLFPYHSNSVTLATCNQTHATSMIGSMTEEFATWNTIKSSEAPETTIPMNIEELGTLPLLPAVQKMARGNPVRNATSHSSNVLGGTVIVTTYKATTSPRVCDIDIPMLPETGLRC